jgi:hypothetical protein
MKQSEEAIGAKHDAYKRGADDAIVTPLRRRSPPSSSSPASSMSPWSTRHPPTVAVVAPFTPAD